VRGEKTDAIAPDRAAKDELHEQFARIGRALGNPHRVELLDLLAQGERSVEVLAARASISVGLASAHLQALRRAGLVVSRRDGTRILYRLAGDDVYELLVAVRTVGTGWATVAVIPASGTQKPLSGSIRAVLTPVSGSWGSGYALSGTLFSVLVKDDGTVAVGAVPVQTLESAVAGLWVARSVESPPATAAGNASAGPSHVRPISSMWSAAR